MKDFEIRPARSADTEAIADVHLDSRREAIVLLHEEVLVAEVNRLVVGFIALEGDHVDHLYIAPAYQGRGIGDTLLAMAKELRPDGLMLWTFQRNARARQFYEA